MKSLLLLLFSSDTFEFLSVSEGDADGATDLDHLVVLIDVLRLSGDIAETVVCDLVVDDGNGLAEVAFLDQLARIGAELGAEESVIG